MKIFKWVLKEIIYFPWFVLTCILAFIFGIFSYRKGMNWLQKNI